MYEILKAIALANNWPFAYGRKDFLNLYEEAELKNTPHIFLDPVVVRDVDNDSGVAEAKSHTGSFMVLMSSDVDEQDYDTRYQNYIKPIISDLLKTIKDGIRCDYSAKFENWQTTEVINMFDYNFDGVICDYQVTIDE